MLHAVEADFSAALEVYERTLKLIEASEGFDQLRYAKLLEEIGITQMRLGEFEAAERMQARSIVLLGEQLGQLKRRPSFIPLNFLQHDRRATNL